MSEIRKLYVGNFPYETSEDALRELFADCGDVRSVRIITDSDGRSKGFGFVEMMTPRGAESALKALDSSSIGGRRLRVGYANPKKDQGGKCA